MLLFLGLHLGVEFLAGNSFTTGELGGNVLAVKGLENLAHIVVLHGVNVLEEGNQANEVLVVGVILLTLPGLENDGILGLLADKLGVSVDDNDLGQITVQVREILIRSVGVLFSNTSLGVGLTLTISPSSNLVASRHSGHIRNRKGSSFLNTGSPMP